MTDSNARLAHVVKTEGLCSMIEKMPSTRVELAACKQWSADKASREYGIELLRELNVHRHAGDAERALRAQEAALRQGLGGLP